MLAAASMAKTVTLGELLRLIDEAAADGRPTLDLSGENLSELPPEIGNLTNLKTLVLGRWDKKKGEVLGNNLSALPDEIGLLTELRSLALSFNQLSSLPAVVGQLSNLTSLDLSGNQLSSLPEVVGQLTNLTSLDLRNNQLSSLPEVVGQLTNLTSLTLWDNKISELPSWIQRLTTLERLDLRANRLPIPREVLGSKNQYGEPASATEVIDYYFQEKEETPLYEAKLIIVGEGAAGKTTLAKKLQDPSYELKEDEKSTEGIEILPYEFDHPDGHRCKVNIWDFGGQEIYHATHQFFLTERAVYALVTDSRQGNTDFYFWLNVIQLYGAESPILLIKNEKQDRPCSVPDLQLRGEFRNLRESIETNLSTGRNLDAIKTALEQYISNLAHVGDALPKAWAQVRSVLENQALGSDNYISIQEYRQICCAQGISSRTEQDRLSRFLHNLGVFLHFQAIPQLAKTIFLKPTWSTDAVYKVLDTKKVRKDCGRFCNEDLNEIWSDHQYADVRADLLALMQEFEVCYEIIGRKNHYIAPHLLEANLPLEHKYDWDATDNLILSYYYPFKPKNILPRFIVSLHRYIEKQKVVWKHGVVLSSGSARAEIIEDVRYEAANVNIRISGTDKKRLLSIIGHEFERIHTSFEDLKYETRIPCNCPECKNDQKPYQFAYEVLQKSLSKHNLQVQCQKSFEMVNVRRLIDDVIDPQILSKQSGDRAQPDKPGTVSPFSPNQVVINFPSQHYQESTTINAGDIRDAQLIIGKNNDTTQTTEINQHGQGDNIAGNKVEGDSINTQINNQQDLTQLGDILTALLTALSEEYNATSAKGQVNIQRDALKTISQDPTLQQRLTNALKAGSEEALEKMIQHPLAKIIVKAIKGLIEG